MPTQVLMIHVSIGVSYASEKKHLCNVRFNSYPNAVKVRKRARLCQRPKMPVKNLRGVADRARKKNQTILPYYAAIPWWNVVPLACALYLGKLLNADSFWWLTSELMDVLQTSHRVNNFKTRPNFQIHSNVCANGFI
jgi:hypothetical protein